MNNRSSAVINWRVRTKLKLIEYKGGCCEVCGYNKPIPGVYEFHHKDPSKKDFSISAKSWNYDRLKAEVDKCSLLCNRCHRELHWELQQPKRANRQELKKTIATEINCAVCDKLFKQHKNNRKHCSKECYSFSQRKVVRPTKEELETLIEKHNFCELGRMFGVTDNAVRKWVKHDLKISNEA
jgi:hypothetical protein